MKVTVTTWSTSSWVCPTIRKDNWTCKLRTYEVDSVKYITFNVEYFASFSDNDSRKLIWPYRPQFLKEKPYLFKYAFFH